MTGLIGLFMRRRDIDRISWLRVPLISFTVISLFIIFSFSRERSITAGDFTGLIIFTIICTPFDFYSIWISKKIFYFKHHTTSRFLMLSLFDIITSLTPNTIILLVVFLITGDVQNFNNSENYRWLEHSLDLNRATVEILTVLMSAMVLSSAFNATSSIFINIVQIIISICGIFINALKAAFRVSARDGDSLSHWPITVCFCVVAFGDAIYRVYGLLTA